MKKVSYLSPIFIIFISFNCLASFIPKNDIYITSKQKSHISQQEFSSLIDKIVNEFEPDMLHHGAKSIVVNKFWEDGKVNASAGKKDDVFTLNVYGGLARHPLINLDALSIVICHELGHLIGGAPTWKPFNIASSEGQADYFATLKCFRRINQTTLQSPSRKDVHPLAWEMCQNQYDSRHDFNLCLKSSIAQTTLTKLLKELANDPALPDFATPDPYERMFIIFNGYPNNQCRLDTMFAGSLCINDTYQKLDMDKYNQGVCHTYKGDIIGIRPKCWYVPRED